MEEYETRVAALLKAPDGKENLGNEIGRIYGIGGIDTRILDNFQASAKQAVAKLILEIAQKKSTSPARDQSKKVLNRKA